MILYYIMAIRSGLLQPLCLVLTVQLPLILRHLSQRRIDRPQIYATSCETQHLHDLNSIILPLGRTRARATQQDGSIRPCPAVRV